jgi:glycine/D-amino acid oxidase-like deaminating enzyme
MSLWPRTRIARVAVAGAGVTLACAASSCSRAVRMSLVEPAALTATPAESHSKGSARFTLTDSVATQDAGVLVVSGDSIRVFERVDHNPGIAHRDEPFICQFKQDARELRILGYQPAHERWREWEGSVRVQSDTLEFRRAATHLNSLRRSTAAETLRVAPGLVHHIDLEQTDPVYTTVMIVGVAAVIVGIAWLGMMTSTSGLSW